MQVNSEPYRLGKRAAPLMDAREEVERATRLRNARGELWPLLLSVASGPDHVLSALREVNADANQNVIVRLQRLGRRGPRGSIALRRLSEELAELDRAGELSSVVIDLLERHGELPERARELQAIWRAEKHRFVVANMGLVFKVASRFNGGSLSLHDLVQEGALGLLRAIDMFDPSRGFRFSTYAVWWIRHAMGRALADRSRTIRVPVHLSTLQTRLRKERPRLREELGHEPTHADLGRACNVTPERVALAELAFSTSVVSLEHPGQQDQDPLELPDEDHREALEFHLASDNLKDSLDQLSPLEADIIRKRFGLEDTSTMTLQEIGRQYDLSRERIRQIELKAIEKMRVSMGIEAKAS